MLKKYAITSALLGVAAVLGGNFAIKFRAVQVRASRGEAASSQPSQLDHLVIPGVLGLYIVSNLTSSLPLGWLGFVAAMALTYGSVGLVLDQVRRNRVRSSE